MNKKFYITSAIPYVNAAPHIGHALEFIQTDAIARYHKLLGKNVLMLCGGDENALKNVQAAEIAGIPIQQFVNTNTDKFLKLSKLLNCNYDIWQKGSDQKHHSASQKLWGLCSHDIYKKKYKGLYCVGCEAFYTPEELDENGECFEHPGRKLDEIEEENYYFKLKKYEKELIKLIQSKELEIIPTKREHEVLSFLDQGLDDISISRLNDRAKNWGVPVPGDNTQRMYVWFDALNIYQTGIGFGWDEKLYHKWWPADVHVIGKGITRFHAIYWAAFLLSAGLKLPKKIFVHEYFTVNGQKMSKTIGNVIDPLNLVNKYGADPLRYYFLAKFSPFSDGDFSEVKFKAVYNTDLANGLGNLIARVAALAKGLNFTNIKTSQYKLSEPLLRFGKSYEFDKALSMIWDKIKECDRFVNDHKIWSLSGVDKQEKLNYLIDEIRKIASDLQPYLPTASKKILQQFKGPTINIQPPLFPRIP